MDFIGEDVEIVHGCDGLSLSRDVRVRDFVDNSQNAKGIGDGVIRVSGRYAALTDAYRDCVLGNGATLDLSARTTPLSTVSAALGKSGQGLSFEKDSTIYIDLGKRRVAARTRILSWDEASKPTGLDTVKFALSPDMPVGQCGLSKEADGLYVVRGIVILIR